MAKVKPVSTNTKPRKLRPALSPEAEESQMITLAYDLAKQQLQDGTASSQVISHFLKLGSTTARLEKERLEEENKLLRAKTENLQSMKENNKLVEEALKAFRNYAGKGDSDEFEDY